MQLVSLHFLQYFGNFGQVSIDHSLITSTEKFFRYPAGNRNAHVYLSMLPSWNNGFCLCQVEWWRSQTPYTYSTIDELCVKVKVVTEDQQAGGGRDPREGPLGSSGASVNGLTIKRRSGAARRDFGSRLGAYSLLPVV